MNKPNKPRTHLFSPHTDQCIYCGKSAEDDAIENTPADLSGQYHVEPAVVKAGCGVMWKATTHHERNSNGVMAHMRMG
jgi:hypothetical protein